MEAGILMKGPKNISGVNADVGVVRIVLLWKGSGRLKHYRIIFGWCINPFSNHVFWTISQPILLPQQSVPLKAHRSMYCLNIKSKCCKEFQFLKLTLKIESRCCKNFSKPASPPLNWTLKSRCWILFWNAFLFQLALQGQTKVGVDPVGKAGIL